MNEGTTRRSFLLLGGAGLATVLAACTGKSSATGTSSVAPATSPALSPATSPSAATSASAPVTPSPAVSKSTTTSAAPAGRPVHVSLLNSDGDVRGVGMPIIAFFNVAPTDAKAFTNPS